MRRTFTISVLLAILLVMVVGAQEESGYGRLWRELQQDLDDFITVREPDLKEISAFHAEILERVTENYAVYSEEFIKKAIDPASKDFFKKVFTARFETTFLERMKDSNSRRSYFRGMAELLSNRAFVLECLNDSKDERLMFMRITEFWNEGGEDSYVPISISNNLASMQASIQASTNDLRIYRVYLQSDWGYQGNMNKAVDAGETIKLGIDLKNLGNRDWRSTSAFLISMDPYVQVDVSEVVYSVRDESTGETRTFVPGMEIPSPTVYTISISPACPDRTRVKLKLRVWDSDFGGADDEYAEYFTLNVNNIGPLVFGDIKIDDDIPGLSDGNGNGRIDPRETIEYQISLRNQGVVPIDNVLAEMSTDAKFISFLKPPVRGSELRFKLVEPKAERPSPASFVFSVGQPETITEDNVWFLLKTTAVARNATYTWLDSYTEKVTRPERLLISTTPEPAEIFVNGTSLGLSPVQTLPLLAGTKIRLDAKLSNGFMFSQTAEVLPGQKELSINLMRELSIISKPENAEIRINGRSAGIAPVKLDPILIGSVIEVEGRFEGMSSKKKIQISGENPLQEIRFEKKMTLLSDPPGAMMSLDRVQLGNSPIETGMLLVGSEHSAAAEYGSWAGAASFIASASMDSFVVRPESGAVVLKVFPENAILQSKDLELLAHDGGLHTADHVRTGKYDIEYSLDGYEAKMLTIEVDPGKITKQEISLERALRVLDIVSTPPGARIMIQGRPIGDAPLQSLPIEVGTRVTIDADFGRMSARREITVKDMNDPVVISPDNGAISLKISPASAEISIDEIDLIRLGGDYKSSDYSADRIPFGEYEISASADGYETQYQYITVSEESVPDNLISLVLAPLKRTISIFTDTENANIEIDGKFVGRSPVRNYPVEHDTEYEVSASLDDYYTYHSESNKVTLSINEKHKDIHLSLIPRTAALSIVRDARYFPSDPDIRINGKKIELDQDESSFEVPVGPQVVEIDDKTFEYDFAEGRKYELKVLYPVPLPSVIVDKSRLNLEREPPYPSMEREYESYETKDFQFSWRDPLAILGLGTIGIYYNAGGLLGLALVLNEENPDWQTAIATYTLGTALEYLLIKIFIADTVTRQRELPEAVSRNKAALEFWRNESDRVRARNKPIIDFNERQLIAERDRVIDENLSRNKATIKDLLTGKETVFDL